MSPDRCALVDSGVLLVVAVALFVADLLALLAGAVESAEEASG